MYLVEKKLRMAGRGKGRKSGRGSEWREVWVECMVENDEGVKCDKWDFKNVKVGSMSEMERFMSVMSVSR